MVTKKKNLSILSSVCTIHNVIDPTHSKLGFICCTICNAITGLTHSTLGFLCCTIHNVVIDPRHSIHGFIYYITCNVLQIQDIQHIASFVDVSVSSSKHFISSGTQLLMYYQKMVIATNITKQSNVN